MSDTFLAVSAMVCLVGASVALWLMVWQQRQRRKRIRRECESDLVRVLADKTLSNFADADTVRAGAEKLREMGAPETAAWVERACSRSRELHRERMRELRATL